MLNFLFVSADKRVASQKPTTAQQAMNRREVLRTGLESLAQQRELQELQRRVQTNTRSRKRLPSERKTAETMKVLGCTQLIMLQFTEWA